MRVILLGLVLAVAGCGLMGRPMIERLNVDDQKQVDGWWVNILAREKGIDRQGMLDIVVSFSLVNRGVDNARYHAEKNVGDRLVTIDVEFDRLRPERDSFVMTVFDKEGAIVRQEKYNRAEVDQTCHDLVQGTMNTEPATQPESPDEIAARKKIEARLAAVAAATQPVAEKK